MLTLDASGLVVPQSGRHSFTSGAGPNSWNIHGPWQRQQAFTTVVMMANTNPTISTVETLKEVLGGLVVKISISSPSRRLLRISMVSI